MSTSKTAKNTAKPATTVAKKSKHQPVIVDNLNRRSDDDALEGHFARVVKGEHEGRIGVLDHVTEYSDKDGYPVTVALVTRDAENEILFVPYEDLRPDVAGHR